MGSGVANLCRELSGGVGEGEILGGTFGVGARFRISLEPNWRGTEIPVR